MTEQLQREETLARAEEQLRQAHKMEAVGQLTGGIAHDFNNMLTGVIASLGLRRLKTGRTDGINDYIEAGLNSAHRAATLTHSQLAFARRQSLDIEAQGRQCVDSGHPRNSSPPAGRRHKPGIQLGRRALARNDGSQTTR
jgi:C4-dicarboxylate-specific signal transduction histidine kinase